ncbi:MAG: 23S rRNA (adenine(2503)-C(2))-methyltransferase RlmN [Deltaproteobacteria bacterium]|nr:23S rRNA (adenine(2503)-C(2))-methyltransferase RlmN [Deltaproteobacteria bacterium]
MPARKPKPGRGPGKSAVSAEERALLSREAAGEKAPEDSPEGHLSPTPEYPLLELLERPPRLGPFRKVGNRIDLRGLSLENLAALVAELKEKPFRATQLSKWIHRKAVTRFDEMTDISLSTRGALSKLAHVDPAVRALEIHPSPDGAVRFLWGLRDELTVESVVIAERDHQTICVSTQVGCRMGCRFCRTATLGFKRNLSQSEILGQIIETKRLSKNPGSITNVVLMGMGEPLDNLGAVLPSLEIITSGSGLSFSAKRISVSTVGIIPSIEAIAKEEKKFNCGLTISLGAPDDSLRSSIMPANRLFPLAELKKTLQGFPLTRGRRLTIAYVLLAGVNDSPSQAAELSRFLTGLKTKINLIPFNPWPGAPYQRPDEAAVEAFKRVLIDKNYTVIVRRSSGHKVGAACGQLVARELGSPNEALSGQGVLEPEFFWQDSSARKKGEQEKSAQEKGAQEKGEQDKGEQDKAQLKSQANSASPPSPGKASRQGNTIRRPSTRKPQ